MTTTSEELISLNKRIVGLELLARERIALSDAYMKRVEELRVELKEINARIHVAEKTIGIIQARMAVITATAAVVGAVTGQLIVKVVTQLVLG